MTNSRRNRPIELSDAPEHRNIPLDQIEVRGDDGDAPLTLTGYASTFEPYEMRGGPAMGGWIERIDPNAFEKTLKEKPDLHLLVNHEGMPLARTKSGTLQLGVDGHGLRVEASLDRSDPDVQRLEPKMRRKDMDEMSFAFRVKGQNWSAAPGFEDDDEETYRLITEVSLHKGDVSVVNFGANPTTQAAVRALRLLEECDSEQLAELRSDALSSRAAAVLDLLTTDEDHSDELDEREDVSEDVVEDIEQLSEPVTLESVLAGIEAAGLTDAVRHALSPNITVNVAVPENQIRAAIEQILAEHEARIEAAEDVSEVPDDEARSDEPANEPALEIIEEVTPKGISLRLALALDED